MNNIKVSTITVTRNRCNFLKNAVNHYLKQTHQNKEMLILYYSDDKQTCDWLNSLTTEWRKDRNIRIFKHIPNNEINLGSLRNFLIENAKGDYVIIWDDDDYYSENRIQFQLRAILEKNVYACALKSLLIFSELRNEVRLSFDRIEGWEGSLMCKRDKIPLYRNQNRYEDTPVLVSLFKKGHVEIIDNPDLYVYFFHDSNISTSFHKEELFNNSIKLSGQRNYQIKKIIGFFK